MIKYFSRKENLLVFFILVIASILRLWDLFSIPFTYDEFSAVFRTRFNDFSTLIANGVKIDTHPAGVQIFLFYWVNWFGEIAWIVKLPFILCGIYSVYLTYKLGKLWFPETTALLAMASLATLQYPVMYSQIARPYAMGMLTCVGMGYCWSKIIQLKDHWSIKWQIGFILMASASSYIHHFSLLFTALLGITGLFLISPKFKLHYILSGLIIFVLYVPHLSILFTQINMGGIEGWLGKPPSDFLLQYFKYVFQFFPPAIITLVGLTIIGLLENKFDKIKCTKGFVFILAVLIPYGIGHLYSYFVNGLLQYSILIFGLPFALIGLFALCPNWSGIKNWAVVIFVMGINIYALIQVRKHYLLFYHSPYAEFMKEQNNIKNKYPNSLRLIHSHPKISQYYTHLIPNMDSNYFDLHDFSDLNNLRTVLTLQSNISEYCYWGYISHADPAWENLIREFYPQVVWQHNHAEGTSLLLRKQPTERACFAKHEFFRKILKGFNTFPINTLPGFLSADQEYTPAWTIPLSSSCFSKYDVIEISIPVEIKDSIPEVLLVSELWVKDKQIDWRATPLTKWTLPFEPIPRVINWHHAIKLSDIPYPKGALSIKVYLWNKGKGNLSLGSACLRIREGNLWVYGLLKPLGKE